MHVSSVCAWAFLLQIKLGVAVESFMMELARLFGASGWRLQQHGHTAIALVTATILLRLLRAHLASTRLVQTLPYSRQTCRPSCLAAHNLAAQS
jgi:hypothetical protein